MPVPWAQLWPPARSGFQFFVYGDSAFIHGGLYTQKVLVHRLVRDGLSSIPHAPLSRSQIKRDVDKAVVLNDTYAAFGCCR